MLAMSLGSSVGRMADERKEVPWYQDVAADMKNTAQGVGQSVTRGMLGAYRGLQWVGRGVGSFFSPLSPDLDPLATSPRKVLGRVLDQIAAPRVSMRRT